MLEEALGRLDGRAADHARGAAHGHASVEPQAAAARFAADPGARGERDGLIETLEELSRAADDLVDRVPKGTTRTPVPSTARPAASAEDLQRTLDELARMADAMDVGGRTELPRPIAVGGDRGEDIQNRLDTLFTHEEVAEPEPVRVRVAASVQVPVHADQPPAPVPVASSAPPEPPLPEAAPCWTEPPWMPPVPIAPPAPIGAAFEVPTLPLAPPDSPAGAGRRGADDVATDFARSGPLKPERITAGPSRPPSTLILRRERRRGRSCGPWRASY